MCLCDEDTMGGVIWEKISNGIVLMLFLCVGYEMMLTVSDICMLLLFFG